MSLQHPPRFSEQTPAHVCKAPQSPARMQRRLPERAGEIYTDRYFCSIGCIGHQYVCRNTCEGKTLLKSSDSTVDGSFPKWDAERGPSHCRFENKIGEEGRFSAYPAFTTWPNVSVTRQAFVGIDKCGFHQSRFIPGAACKQNIHAFEFLMATVIAKSGRRARPFFVKTKHGIRCYPNLVYMGTTVQNALNFVFATCQGLASIGIRGRQFQPDQPVCTQALWNQIRQPRQASQFGSKELQYFDITSGG